MVRQESAEPERNISTETGFTFKKADIERDKKESPSPAQQPAVQVKTENDKDTYTPEEEDRVFSSLKSLWPLRKNLNQTWKEPHL